MVALVKLVAISEDMFGYITYVFECLEEYMIKQTKYIMTTRWPNWEHRLIEINEIGYLNFKEIRAGIDTWWDGTQMVPFKYDTVQFIKFVEKPEQVDHKYVM